MNSDAPHVQALAAIRACHEGRVDEGAGLYRRALRSPGGFRLPVGLHARMLASSGHAEAAERLLREGVAASADVSIGASGDRRASIAEYESLFARDLSNAHMMANYVAHLSHAGESAKLASAMDPRLLFRTARMALGSGVLSRAAAALQTAATRQFEASRRSVRNLDRVPRTHEHPDPDIRAIHGAVRGEIVRYLADVRGSRHAVGRWLPGDVTLHSWSVITERGGYNVPHIHLGCWVVAVAYIAGGASDDDAGALRVGAAPAGDARCEGWPDLRVAPEPGTLVIMPAFYTHWTVPLAKPGLRISIAFNAHDAGWGDQTAEEIHA